MYRFDRHTQLRLHRGAECLCRQGPRAPAELLADVAQRIGGMPAILAALAEYGHLSVATIRAAGGDRFPPRLSVMPEAAT